MDVGKTVKEWADRLFSLDDDASSDTQAIRNTAASVPTYKGNSKGDGAVKNAAQTIKNRKKTLDEI